MEHFAELVSFISNPSENVRTVALKNLLGFCKEEHCISFFMHNVHSLAILCDLTCDPKSHTIRKLALACLITITSVCKVMFNSASVTDSSETDSAEHNNSEAPKDNAPPSVDGHHAIFELLVVQCKLVERLMERLVLIMREDNKLPLGLATTGDTATDEQNRKLVDEHNEIKQMILVLLSTLTQTEQGQRQLMQIPLLRRRDDNVKRTSGGEDDFEDDFDEEDEDSDSDDDFQGFYVQKLVELLEYVPVKLAHNEQEDSVSSWSKELEEKVQRDPTKWIPNILTNITTLEQGRSHMLQDTDVDTMRRVMGYARDVNPIKRNGIVSLIRNCLFDKSKHAYLVDQVKVLQLLMDRLRDESNVTIRKIVAECLWMCTVSEDGLEALTADDDRLETLKTLAEGETDNDIKELLDKIVSTRDHDEQGEPEGVVMPDGVEEGDLVTIDPDTHEVKLLAKKSQEQNEEQQQ